LSEIREEKKKVPCKVQTPDRQRRKIRSGAKNFEKQGELRNLEKKDVHGLGIQKKGKKGKNFVTVEETNGKKKERGQPKKS